MKEYKFSIEKKNGLYEIKDADVMQSIFEDPLVLPLGALVSFYKQLAQFCYDECIGGNSFYGNHRDLPWVYAILRDKACEKESRQHMFCFCKSDNNAKIYEIWHLICNGNTLKYYLEREAVNTLCGAIYNVLKDLDDERINIWENYMLNKLTEDVPLDFDTFTKWVKRLHPDTPSCYYEVAFDAWDAVNDHLPLRQTLDIAAAYIKDHQHDYD